MFYSGNFMTKQSSSIKVWDAPGGLNVKEHLMYTQSMAQTRDSQKADCDRKYAK